ncbi:MAG TPA: SDR family oxidoreductase, partial [Chryseosolibacter sp.]|nr:SDR family oxidoreductase [Chryseosolibacter sp.]
DVKDVLMSKNILILGATSDLALALARKFAANGHSLTLAARNVDKLEATRADLQIRHRISVHVVRFDAVDTQSHAQFYHSLPEKPEVVLCVFGLLGNHPEAETDWAACEEILMSNFVGAVSILNIVANDMQQRKSGVIVGISSVAGERGRQSNYFYGSAKAGFTAYLSGLRNRLERFGVHVVTVKPGFIRTKMIDHVKTPEHLTADPKAVADDIFNAVIKRKNVIYTKWVWRPIMYLIKTIPESIFKKMRL